MSKSIGGLSNNANNGTRTKDDLINQAHEARQNRELVRRREKSATIIQAFLKSLRVRHQLKFSSCQKLDELVKLSYIPDNVDLLYTIRSLIFVCHPGKDRNTIDSLLKLILTTATTSTKRDDDTSCNISALSNDSNISKVTVIEKKKINLLEEAIEESRQSSDYCIELEPQENLESTATVDNHYDKNVDESNINADSFRSIEKPSYYYDSFVGIILRDSLRSNRSHQQWLSILAKILGLCLDYLRDASSTRLDSQHIDTYLKIINLLSSLSKFIDPANTISVRNKTSPNLDRQRETKKLDEMSLELVKKIINRENFFKCITKLISGKINRFRNDLKTSILKEYTQIALRLIKTSQECLKNENINDNINDNVIESFNNEQNHISEKIISSFLIDILVKMFSIPGFIWNLEKYSPKALQELNDNSIFELVLKGLVKNHGFQRLTSSASVCLLANIIHLSSLNESSVVANLMTYVMLVTKLAESCQKNMLQVSSAIISGNPKLSNKNINQNYRECGSSGVSFNPILGWLSREQMVNLDKEIIKSQLSHLWSHRSLRTLFNDLIKTNEKSTASSQNANNGNKNQQSSPKFKSVNSVIMGNSFTQSLCDNTQLSSGLTMGLIRRVVERATTTVTRTMDSPYSKTGSSCLSSSSKLMTPEANRISLVCLMLHTTLKTLTTLRQDFLMGLCLNEYILSNLWTFISSLGPHNGLKAFLDYLAIYTKTSAPEFHILTFFCEFASHLISILDDSELYEKQQPFRLEDLIAISTFLNNFVFRVICNNLIAPSMQSTDPILQTTHKLLTDLYKRDCRRKFAPKDHWLIKDIKMSIFIKDLEANKHFAKAIVCMLPHVIPHKERVSIFRKLVAKDKNQHLHGPSTLITIHRSRIVEDGYQQLVRLPPSALKGLIRVKFINDYGLDEAGIDENGVFKEFLEDTIKKVFDPALNLFCSTSEQLLYPSPTSRLHEEYLSLFNFVGKMLGKAIYEGIVVDVPFASFFLSRVLGQPLSPLYSPIDELPSLDPELYKSLTYIKHYKGDVSELNLTFSIDQDFMGKIETHELEVDGKSTPVTRETRVRYIHAVANFHMKTQIEKQTEAFLKGFKSIISTEWLSMFSASELQRLISGDNTPIDLQDLRRNTKYFGGFHNNHRIVCWLWDILERDFSSEEHKLFLKFVTSCSKPPLLGFANLEPSFSIRCVEVSDDQDSGDTVGSVLRGFFAIRRSDPVDRLPTASTCFNLLKLPNYQRRSTLREKLRYAIRSSPGFELS